MKSRPTQFGVREHTASPRQHASRLAVGTPVNIVYLAEKSLETQPTSPRNACSVKDSEKRLHAASQDEPTGEHARDGGAIFSMCTK
jgi:hypothetical protein